MTKINEGTMALMCPLATLKGICPCTGLSVLGKGLPF
jgi:hypothetical protein